MLSSQHPAINNLTLELPLDLKKQLDLLAQTTHKTQIALAIEALRTYVELSNWQIDEIKKGVEELNAGNFASDAEVETFFSKWK